MSNFTVEVETLKELIAYQRKGYTSSIEDISIQLGVSIKKARELTRDVPKVHIKESLYYRLKYKGDTAHRIYFNSTMVFKYLIQNDLLHVYFYTPEELHIVYGKYIHRDGEVKIDKKYIINRLSNFQMLLRASKSVKDIILESEDYEGYIPIFLGDGKEYFMDEAGEMFIMDEIISKSDIVTYTRKIQQDFYIKFKIGEVGKRGKVKYFQSIRNEKVKNLSDSIDRWMKEYEAEGKE